MRVLGKPSLEAFWKSNADAEQPLQAWVSEAENAEWETPHHVRARYASASILGNKRVIFNIKGNRYRLVTEINYQFGIVLIRFIGTHAQYDRIDAETI